MKNKIIEYRGEWCTPKYRNILVPGILTIDSETKEIKLVLYSEIDFAGKIIREQRNTTPYCKIILGTTDTGDEITLYDHSNNEGGAPILHYAVGGDLYESVYRPSIVFVGKHFQSQAALKFKKYYFQYSYLDSWIDTAQKYFNFNGDNPTDLNLLFQKSNPMKLK